MGIMSEDNNIKKYNKTSHMMSFPIKEAGDIIWLVL